MAFRCRECREPLSISVAGSVDPDNLASPEAFMTLRFELSSTAKWECSEHGPVGPVVVAVIDDHVEFVSPFGDA